MVWAILALYQQLETELLASCLPDTDGPPAEGKKVGPDDVHVPDHTTRSLIRSGMRRDNATHVRPSVFGSLGFAPTGPLRRIFRNPPRSRSTSIDMLKQTEPMHGRVLRPLITLGASVVALVACTARNPEFCEDTSECNNGSVCGADHGCHPADAGVGLDGSDAAGGDGAITCVPELLFVRDGLFTNGQVFRVDLESFEEHSISNGTDTDVDAEWSPDGQRVIVTRNAGSIGVVDRDGANFHEVDNQSGMLLAGAQWSPDGTRVAYTVSALSGGTAAIYSAAVNGSSGINLTPGLDAQDPMWSPNGSQLLFTSDQSGNREVFSMAASGSNRKNLTNRANNDDQARWSPDGTQIALTQLSQVWIAADDGANLHSVTATVFASPIWSSDGQQIFFVKDPAGAGQLFVMNANGTNQHPLETNPAIDLEPNPSPDGRKIAWSSKRDGNFEIYVANSDGSNPVRVTNNSRPDTRPRWRPCP